MVMDLMRLVASPEAERLISTVKRLMDDQGLTTAEIADHLSRLERASKRTGKRVKEICDESMNLYENKK